MKYSYEKTIAGQKEIITELESTIAYLKRRIWGKSSERFVNEDPRQRRIDFDGLELLEEEEQALEKATTEIQSFKVKTVQVRVKEKPVRKPLPANLPRREDLGCWAHIRRKFEESLSNDKARAEYALTQIGLLYDVERKADAEQLSLEERAELRSRLSYPPIMIAFEKWLVYEYPKVLPKSLIGKAIQHTYKNYHRLTCYHLDGRYKIDNNLIENSVCPVALGKKNFLFCGNHDAAEDAAVIYSMMGCCKAAEVNFREWFVYVLNNTLIRSGLQS